MLLVRETFVAKPGNASKLAKMFLEHAPVLWGGAKVQVLTDLTGQFNRVVLETEVESLTAYDEMWKKMEKDKDSEAMKKMQEAMKNYTDMYETGYRDLYRIW